MKFDNVPDETRRRMQAIRKTDTKPELIVRKLVYSLGYRYRLYRRDLPGTPDLVFSGRRKVIFVHGCFWHQHERCRLANKPRSRTQYWLPKLERNKDRDIKNLLALRKLGWKTLVIWECETSDKDQLRERLLRFLEES